MANIQDVAKAFVNLVRSHSKEWRSIKELSPVEVKVLFDVVTLAGFEPSKIVAGEFEGWVEDQDGSKLYPYIINEVCRYTVIGEGGEANAFATGWLNDLFSMALGLGSDGEPENIALEIERSIPLSLIQISGNGDMLGEYPCSTHDMAPYPYMVDHSKDSEDLSCFVGVHYRCGGWVDRCNSTKTRDVLVCRGCGLRFRFPTEVKTYGDLRVFSKGSFATVSADHSA